MSLKEKASKLNGFIFKTPDGKVIRTIGGSILASLLPPDFDEKIATCFVHKYKCQNMDEEVLMKKLCLLKCHFTWDISTVQGTHGISIRDRMFHFSHYIDVYGLGFADSSDDDSSDDDSSSDENDEVKKSVNIDVKATGEENNDNTKNMTGDSNDVNNDSNVERMKVLIENVGQSDSGIKLDNAEVISTSKVEDNFTEDKTDPASTNDIVESGENTSIKVSTSNSAASEIENSTVTDDDELDSTVLTASEVMLYSYLVQLAYCFALCKHYNKALDLLDLATDAVEMKNLELLREGFKYVIDCNRAFVWMLKQEYEHCSQILDEVTPFEELSPVNAAAVIGAYGTTLLELGLEGWEKASSVFEYALSLDTQCYYWYFVLGLALFKVRHIKDHAGLPTDLECNAFRRASFMAPKEDELPMIYLAQCLRDKSSAMFRSGYRHHNGESCDELNSEAKVLCDRVMERKTGFAFRELVRVADVYMKLPKPYQDVNKAEMCLKQALVRGVNDIMANHKMATFYEIIKKDYHKALEYLEKAANCGGNVFQVDLKMVDLKTLLQEDYNPVIRLTEMLGSYNREVDSQVANIYILRGCFHFLKYDQLDEAIEDWLQAFHIKEERFDQDFSRMLHIHCFKEDSEMRQKIETIPSALKMHLMTSQRNDEKENLCKKITTLVLSFRSVRYNPRQSSGRQQMGEKQKKFESRSDTVDNWRS